MASTLSFALPGLPRFIVLQSHNKIHFLGYVHNGGEFHQYLSFMETEAISPFAKFEVEESSKDPQLVHIRSCQNNRYFVRTNNLSVNNDPNEQYWITASADKPEEDQSKESCTLFKPIAVDLEANTVRIMHVQSECYLCLWGITSPGLALPVLANNKVHDHQSMDVFTVLDWESIVILPRYLAFKGDNDKYLCVRKMEGHPFLQFSSDRIDDSAVACEIFYTPDGNIRIKSTCPDKFWRRSGSDLEWIWADSSETPDNDNYYYDDILFRPVKVNDTTIGLVNLGNNHFCKRFTSTHKSCCLNANVACITQQEAKLRVEEPITKREIYDVIYNLDDSRVYGEQILLLAESSGVNCTQEPASLDMVLTYKDTRTSTWNTMFSLKLGMKATINEFNITIPLISEGSIKLSDQVQSGVQWGRTETTSATVETVHKIVFPPMTKVKVSLFGTKGMCDVPFTFMQRDTLYNGKFVTTQVLGGVYTGSNYYNIKVETKEEKLIP